MTRFGYSSSCQEYGPAGLVRHARLAQGGGFEEVYIGQAGGEHEGFFDFYSSAALPRLREG